MEDTTGRDSKIYVSRIHQSDAETIDRLTQPSRWDYAQFRQVLIALGIVGGGYSIPARNRPDSVHLQGWRRDIDELMSKTAASGKEHGKLLFVDREKGSLLMGPLIVGAERQVKMKMKPEPGREGFQRVVAMLHIHPNQGIDSPFVANGFGNQDYITLLENPELQASLLGYGDNNLMLALKTSVTPNNLSGDAITRRVTSINEEFLNDSLKHPVIAVAEFNKAVCAEFGLVLYTGNAASRDLVSRVEVTK